MNIDHDHKLKPNVRQDLPAVGTYTAPGDVVVGAWASGSVEEEVGNPCCHFYYCCYLWCSSLLKTGTLVEQEAEELVGMLGSCAVGTWIFKVEWIVSKS